MGFWNHHIQTPPVRQENTFSPFYGLGMASQVHCLVPRRKPKELNPNSAPALPWTIHTLQENFQGLLAEKARTNKSSVTEKALISTIQPKKHKED